jgi:hypothetical protein
VCTRRSVDEEHSALVADETTKRPGSNLDSALQELGLTMNPGWLDDND